MKPENREQKFLEKVRNNYGQSNQKRKKENGQGHGKARDHGQKERQEARKDGYEKSHEEKRLLNICSIYRIPIVFIYHRDFV